MSEISGVSVASLATRLEGGTSESKADSLAAASSVVHLTSSGALTGGSTPFASSMGPTPSAAPMSLAAVMLHEMKSSGRSLLVYKTQQLSRAIERLCVPSKVEVALTHLEHVWESLLSDTLSELDAEPSPSCVEMVHTFIAAYSRIKSAELTEADDRLAMSELELVKMWESLESDFGIVASPHSMDESMTVATSFSSFKLVSLFFFFCLLSRAGVIVDNQKAKKYRWFDSRL